MYRLVVCDRPGCSKLHKVVPATRSGVPLGAAPRTGSQDPGIPPGDGQLTLSVVNRSGDR